MSRDPSDIAAFAEEVLHIQLLPWQVRALEAVVSGNYGNTIVIGGRRTGRRRGIEQMNAVLDELRESALWADPSVELAIVHQVAAKYLPSPDLTPRPTRHLPGHP